MIHVDVEPGELLRFLMTRRWFGAKGREPQRAHVIDAIPVGREGWIARAEVVLRDGVDRYQVMLRGQGPGAKSHGEGLDDPAFRRELGDVVARGGALEGPGVRWVVDWVGEAPDELPAPLLAGVEQSNTSLIFGDVAIMKLYRRLEQGEHPDAEMARFLTTRAHFPNTPELLATARFESSSGIEVAAMLQRFLPGSRNARVVALERGSEVFRGAGDSRIPFAVEAETLGAVTRAMHVALASDARDPAFAPEPATRSDVAEWADAACLASERAMELLERARVRQTLPPSIRMDAEYVLRGRDDVRALVVGWLTELGEDLGARIRHHGDYHLEQVLQAADGKFMVIDFEGEPARSLEQRRAKHSALRDVAGMLRSFWYAAASGIEAARGELGDAEAMGRGERWERAMREAFLRGYLPESGDHSPFLPRARAHLDVLLELFEMEKLFYELSYELNNRPTWVWIPLRGIVSMLRAAPR
jgi:trehalose synthase-fused probable maltokinase